MIIYKVQSPILFLIFNRPNYTLRVFEKIKAAQPSRLYIAADGPRKTKEQDASLCEQARSISKLIDWDCEVQTLFRDKNLGCKEAVGSAIDWFFEQEEEGIILEDDCLPANDFFRFCDVLLERYRNDTRISHIAGCDFKHNGPIVQKVSYYFSNLTHIWGWASWRRVWQDYDKDLKAYEKADLYKPFFQVYDEPLIAKHWMDIFHSVKGPVSKVNTWDYQFFIINLLNNRLSIVPNANLISNIGFGADATHVSGITETPYMNMPLRNLGEITHPQYMVPDKKADLYKLNFEFDIDRQIRKRNSMKGRIKSCLKKWKNLLLSK